MGVVTETQPKVDEQFQDLLYDLLLRLRERREAERGPSGPRDVLYVSEVGTVIGESACWRKLWYDFHGAPKDPLPPETLMAFEIGDVIGLRISNILAAGDHVQKVQYRLDFSPWPVSGRLDVLLIPKWKRVVEVKSIPYAMLPYLPKADHIAQLNLYLHGIRQEPEYTGFDGTLLYVVKDARKGQPVCRAYEILYSPKNALVTLNAYMRGRQAATGPTVPPRPKGFTRSTYPCAYCVFQTYCWSGKDSINISSEPDGPS